MLQRVGTAGNAVDSKPGLAQALLKVHAGFRFIFGDQQFHWEILICDRPVCSGTLAATSS
jgi:hypothetical protein